MDHRADGHRGLAFFQVLVGGVLRRSYRSELGVFVNEMTKKTKSDPPKLVKPSPDIYCSISKSTILTYTLSTTEQTIQDCEGILVS